ncbi:MAG TPA: DUF882 domain-containing protein [Polyangiaceae bacterium]|nr:DUF882 domain-containing protein [Polyangiaceae bacterium]
MRAARLARPLAFMAALATAGGALAQPPSARSKRAIASTAARRDRAATMAYVSGKQPLVGLHAPSSKPVLRDEGNRPLLALNAINRGESIAISAANDDGGFASADLDRVARLLRAMGGDEHPIDPRTLSLVYGIQTHFGVPEISVISGYRVPRPGSQSNHGKGRAMDIVVPGVADEEVARFARELGFVGVGVYPASQFVHVDVRPRSYFWVDSSGPHMRNRERGILGDLAAKSDAAALERGQVPIEPFAVSTNVDSALQARGIPSVAPASTEEDEDDE